MTCRTSSIALLGSVISTQIRISPSDLLVITTGDTQPVGSVKGSITPAFVNLLTVAHHQKNVFFQTTRNLKFMTIL